MTKKEMIDEILDHFHPESVQYGGWPLSLARMSIDLKLINKEFPGLFTVVKDGTDTLLTRTHKTNFSDKHTVQVLRTKAAVYKKEFDRLAKKIDSLYTSVSELAKDIDDIDIEDINGQS